jgi:exonuclease III
VSRKLLVATLNVRGLGTGTGEVIQALSSHALDVLVLTETKLTKNSKGMAYQWLANLGCKQYHCVTMHIRTKAKRG